MRRITQTLAAAVLAATLGAWVSSSAKPHVHDRPVGAAECALCIVRESGAVAPDLVAPPAIDRTPIDAPADAAAAPVYVDRFAVPESRGPPV